MAAWSHLKPEIFSSNPAVDIIDFLFKCELIKTTIKDKKIPATAIP